ncbi:MAG: class I SAM-dependent methyltransferase [Planctomyces sp.]|nr:class I SAM-dependent methyltransferase [Planctomyces sp.]
MTEHHAVSSEFALSSGMRCSEYELMAAVEDRHWWYQGLRSSFESVLSRCGVSRTTLFNGSVLDAGCGTGGNLKWLRDTYQPQYLTGFDVSSLAIEYVRAEVPEARLFVADLCGSEIPSSSYQLIVCSDVLYATHLESAVEGLRTLCRQLTCGGYLLLHLPACEWLKSSHDVAVQTRQRFTRDQVRCIVESLGLQVEFLSFRMFALFPLFILRRLPSILSLRYLRTENRSEQSSSRGSHLKMPSSLVNWTLTQVMKLENAGLKSGVRYPWGSSLIAVGRKR